MHLGYRLQQFLRTLLSRPDPTYLAEAAEVLPPNHLLLFRSMDLADQAHSLRVMRALRRQGEEDPDLLAAALLHDVGKARFPLSAWQRSLIVLTQAAFPGWAERLGKSKPDGWRRPFAIAVQHPQWGAQLVAEVGGSERLIKLIDEHQNEPGAGANSDFIRSLRALQAADNRN